MLPKLNSAHGSDTRNIINRAIEVLNRLGIDVQTLVADGQLTPEQYSKLIQTVNSLISRGDVKLNDLSPEILEAINNSDGTPFEILSIPRDRSVTHEKTDFIEASTNLFDKKTAVSGVINFHTGALGPHDTYYSTPFITAKPNQAYTYDRFNRIIYYDENKNRIGGDESIARPATFTSVNNTAFIRLSVPFETHMEEAFVGESEKYHGYEPYYVRLNGDKVNVGLDAFSKDIKDDMEYLLATLATENENWEA